MLRANADHLVLSCPGVSAKAALRLDFRTPDQPDWPVGGTLHRRANVARTTPYSHNGYFRRLDEMIAFIDERDPTITLTRQDILNLTAFLATLTDASAARRP